MDKQLIALYHLYHREEIIVDGETWILADLGYEDDEGFMKRWWSIGLMKDGMFEHHDDVKGHSSFTGCVEAAALALKQISTYKTQESGENRDAA